MNRQTTRQVLCGGVAIGGGAPITIQSMTNTDTRDIQATSNQIKALAEAGCEIVRVAVPDMQAAEAIKDIKKASPIPLVADIHFDYRLALLAIQNGADKIRINPGNIGSEERVRQVVSAAKERGLPIRIGVNGGSLEKHILAKYGGVTAKGLAESAAGHIQLLEMMDFHDIVVSIKSSDVVMNYQAHMLLAEQTGHPFHIGVTEAGTPARGKMKSAIGIGALLLAGIGDTVRVSLTGNPVHEMQTAQEILQTCGLRSNQGVHLISCPTCGRCRVNMEAIVNEIEQKLNAVGPLTQEIRAAVMGCEVNGPGEAREADVGIAFGNGKAALFKKGEVIRTVAPEEAAGQLIGEIKRFAERDT